MPLSPRQKGPRKNSRGGEEEYVVFLQGIPPQCRWQELKDLVRQTAHHIRQAVVYDDCHGRPTGLGQIIVKNEDEAWRTYNKLSANGWDGHSLTVTLSLASAPTKPIAGPSKSPPSVRRQPSHSQAYSSPPRVNPNMSTPSPSASPGKYTMSPQSYQWQPEYQPFLSNLAVSGYQPLAPDMSSPMTYVMPMIFNNKGPVAFPTPTAHSPNFDSYPHPVLPYATQNSHPLHEIYVNSVATKTHRHDNNNSRNSSDSSNHSSSSSISTISGGFTQPCRSVSIQNLNPKVTWQNLKGYLRAAGVVDRCEIPVDRRSGRPSSGAAKATFRTTEEARNAITLFDHSYFMGSRIRVTFGADAPGTGFTSSRYSNSGSNSNVKVGTELLNGTGKEAMVNSMTGKKKVDMNEPLVVNGSSVGSKSSGLCPRASHNPTSHLVQEPRAVWSH